MKTTAKARVIKSGAGIPVRPIDLVQEKLARSRLLLKLEQHHQRLLNGINQVLKPLIRQGGAGLSRVSLEPVDECLTACQHHVWFSLSYHRKMLGLWRIDRCTLEQLASSYYGGHSGRLFSPLRGPTQSEFRLDLKLFQAALVALPLQPIDPNALQIEQIAPGIPIDVAACWQMYFADDYPAVPMLFGMTDNLMNLMSDLVQKHEVSADIAPQLEQRLQQIPVRVKLDIGSQHMPVDALSSLNTGDVIPLNLHRRCPVTLGQRPLFYASVHAHEGQLVARLNQDAYQEEELNRG
ncbi:hypothetical protein NFHSH190041_01880 [Shewanella sp. NFH-SH190041]|uniref:FliM/FliN family flagellar motor switch protein n=1 Tax=Shewanella sp. NFH-SH190041 TaxID=2950245 RepID=UPI0021C42867|nr:FliM/FliN family flagellar motor switch protein [Shewanella sp. NFH-SH190041]BDM62736.1 hypothetical protein NFHSH190041_01880 [Shewanella sp. NFH-SH190041]